MKLFFVDGMRAGEELEFAVPEITVGREPDNLVTIPVGGISRYHGKFYRTPDGRWFVRDSGSTNGIKFQGKRIESDLELHEGDVVMFGNQMIRVTGLKAASPVVVLSELDGTKNDADNASKKKPESPVTVTPVTLSPSAEPSAAASAPVQTETPQKKELSASEISDALKNGKLRLFGGKPNGGTPSAHAEGNGTASGRKPFSNWIFCTIILCFAVMGVSAFYGISGQGKRTAGAPVSSTEQVNYHARHFMLYYEKNIVDKDNVFYFVLHIENGTASFQIDDLKSSRSFVRKDIRFLPEAYEDFHNMLERENFFGTLSPAPGSAPGNSRDLRRMVICDRGRLHEVTVRNNMRPRAFEELEQTINSFAENFALRTVSMTPEELQEQAKQSFYKAEELFANREAQDSNLRQAIARYRLTVEYLDAFVPKPALWNRARKQLEIAERLRKDKIAALKTERIRLANLQDFSGVLPVLDKIMALSDPDSQDFSDARRMRIQVDRVLRQRGGRR